MEIKSGFDHLDRLTAKGPNHKEFVEPKVQGLWRIALEAKFSPDELASLKVCNLICTSIYITGLSLINIFFFLIT